MSIGALIVDDEHLARKRIRRLVAEEPDISVLGECGSGREAIAAIVQTNPDLLFLDIQMPGLSGLEVAAKLSRDVRVVFTTAYDQHALAAFEVNAVDYLLKPIDSDRLKATLERLSSRRGEPGADVQQRIVGG